MAVAMGAWTGVAISLSCECTNPSHVALGHVLPTVLLSLFGDVRRSPARGEIPGDGEALRKATPWKSRRVRNTRQVRARPK